MAEGTILTESGLKKLEEELDYLVSVRRNEISEQIAVARGFGDLSENAEYDAARNDQAKLEGEILELEATVRNAIVVSDDEITNEKVNLGTTVTVFDETEQEQDEYRIVGPSEADPMNNIISTDSPVGAALLGKKVGQTAVVAAPNGEIRLKVLAIART